MIIENIYQMKMFMVFVLHSANMMGQRTKLTSTNSWVLFTRRQYLLSWDARTMHYNYFLKSARSVPLCHKWR